MRSVIIYYSCSGNTKKVAQILQEQLKGQGDTRVIELIAIDEPASFFAQARRALFRKRAKIECADFDLSGYDLVCFGTPVWAFAPAPAMNSYLDSCKGLEYKKTILFTTYGSGTGNQRCLNYMQAILSKKGVAQFSRFSVQQAKVGNREYIISKIEEATRL